MNAHMGIYAVVHEAVSGNDFTDLPGKIDHDGPSYPLDLQIEPVRIETPLVGLIRTIGGLNLGYGPWVAGGAARCVFEGIDLRQPSDIDYFCPSPDVSDRVEMAIRAATKVQEDGRSINQTSTIQVNFCPPWQKQKARPWTFQVVRSVYYETASELLRNFDLTVCQFVTDGHYVIYPAQSGRDVRERRLRYSPHYNRHRTTVPRMLKYLNRGFTPVPGMLKTAYKNQIDRGNVTCDRNGRIRIGHDY